MAKIAVVGAGEWGRNHVRTLAALPETRLCAVCDLDETRRREVSRAYPGVNVGASLDDVIADADGVVLATPGNTHAQIAREILAARKHLLVEKPMALSVADASALRHTAAEQSVQLLVGHLLLFHPAIVRLKDMIANGDLGNVYYLYSQRVNLGQVRPDENALWSFGPHDVSVALNLLDASPTRVAAHGRSYLQHGVEDVVFLNMEFASGAMMNVQLSWLDPHKERRLTVVGSEKMVVFDDMEAREKLKVFDKGIDRPPEYGSFGESLSVREGDIFVPRIPNAEPLSAELRHFAAVIDGAPNDRVNGDHGVEVIKVLAAANESLKRGGAFVELSDE